MVSDLAMIKDPCSEKEIKEKKRLKKNMARTLKIHSSGGGGNLEEVQIARGKKKHGKMGDIFVGGKKHLPGAAYFRFIKKNCGMKQSTKISASENEDRK